MKVLLTGAASGIGKATAEKLDERGHDVTGYDINDGELEKLDFRTYHGDVYDEERVREAVDETEFDVLVNCAGYYELGALEDVDAETVEKHFQTNVFGPLNFIRNSIDDIEGGKVINVTSVAGFMSMPFFGVYCATKHSMEAISHALRLEAEKRDIDVVIVEPGPVETGFNRRARQELEKYLPESFYSEEYEEMLDSGGMNGVKAGKAAEKIVEAVEADNPKIRYRVTWQAHVLAFLNRVFPTRMKDRLIKSFSDY